MADSDQVHVKVRVGSDLSIVVPPTLSEALGLKEGDVLFARVQDGEIHLLTPTAAMRRAQAIVREFVPEGVSLVDELLEDRRREVEAERQEEKTECSPQSPVEFQHRIEQNLRTRGAFVKTRRFRFV